MIRTEETVLLFHKYLWIGENSMVKCEMCGSYVGDREANCPYCGDPMNNKTHCPRCGSFNVEYTAKMKKPTFFEWLWLLPGSRLFYREYDRWEQLAGTLIRCTCKDCRKKFKLK